MGNSTTPWRGAWALIVFLQLFWVILLSVPTQLWLLLWSRGVSERSHTRESPDALPPQATCTSCERRRAFLESTGPLLACGQDSTWPHMFYYGWCSGLLGIFLPCLRISANISCLSPITYHVTDLISVTSMWTTGESETFHSGVLKVVLLWGNLNWGTDRNWSFQIIGKYNWKIELGLCKRENWTAWFEPWENWSLRF